MISDPIYHQIFGIEKLVIQQKSWCIVQSAFNLTQALFAPVFILDALSMWPLFCTFSTTSSALSALERGIISSPSIPDEGSTQCPLISPEPLTLAKRIIHFHQHGILEKNEVESRTRYDPQENLDSEATREAAYVYIQRWPLRQGFFSQIEPKLV